MAHQGRRRRYSFKTRLLLIPSLWIVSGGFAIVQPGSQLSINAVEGFPLEDFNADVSKDDTHKSKFGR